MSDPAFAKKVTVEFSQDLHNWAFKINISWTYKLAGFLP